MSALSRSTSTDKNHGHAMANGRATLDVLGAISAGLILVFCLGALTMIPDFIRYLRIKNM